jgi:hypothetical protein
VGKGARAKGLRNLFTLDSVRRAHALQQFGRVGKGAKTLCQERSAAPRAFAHPTRLAR